MNFRGIRITFFLCLLFVIFGYSTFQKKLSREWDNPLELKMYLINAEQSKETEAYIESLTEKNFERVHYFLRQEARKYHINTNKLLNIEILPPPEVLPPALPESKTGINVLIWSLKLRYWAFKYLPTVDLNVARIDMFAFYYEPKPGRALSESTGIQEGLIGIANLFGSKNQEEQNNIVIVHELLHTLGATDKYSLYDSLPIFPEGYANSRQQPLYPQLYAEIMAGRIPLSQTEAKIPTNLFFCRIGEKTATEINWLEGHTLPWYQQKWKELQIVYSEIKNRLN